MLTATGIAAIIDRSKNVLVSISLLLFGLQITVVYLITIPKPPFWTVLGIVHIYFQILKSLPALILEIKCFDFIDKLDQSLLAFFNKCFPLLRISTASNCPTHHAGISDEHCLFSDFLNASDVRPDILPK